MLLQPDIHVFLTFIFRCSPRFCFLVLVNWEVNHKKFLITSLRNVKEQYCFEGDQSTERNTDRDGGFVGFLGLP